MLKYINFKYIICALFVLVNLTLFLVISFSFFEPKASVDDGTTFTTVLLDVNEVAFSSGTNIDYTSTKTNFYDTTSNLLQSTSPQIKIIPNEKRVGTTTSQKYNILFSVLDNTFVKTNPGTAELLLSITKPDGTKLTSISGLNYIQNANGSSGFDITDAAGDIQVVNDYEIVSDNINEVIHTWTFDVILVNVGAENTDNFGKIFNAKILINVN